MKFLIDECLHTSLVRIAKANGHDGTHVNWRGWSGVQDWNLMDRIMAEDFTFVTNNARDFRRLHGRETLHAWLVILLPNVSPPEQRRLFDAILGSISATPDLVNQAVEATFKGQEIEIIRYDLPPAP